MQPSTHLLERIGRLLLGSLFLLGGLNKLLNFEGTAARMQDVGLEPASFLLIATIALELSAGACVILLRSGKVVGAAALSLALFTAATNIFFHDFWNLEADAAARELAAFFKNVSVMGGLCIVAAFALRQDAGDEA